MQKLTEMFKGVLIAAMLTTLGCLAIGSAGAVELNYSQDTGTYSAVVRVEHIFVDNNNSGDTRPESVETDVTSPVTSSETGSVTVSGSTEATDSAGSTAWDKVAETDCDNPVETVKDSLDTEHYLTNSEGKLVDAQGNPVIYDEESGEYKRIVYVTVPSSDLDESKLEIISADTDDEQIYSLTSEDDDGNTVVKYYALAEDGSYYELTENGDGGYEKIAEYETVTLDALKVANEGSLRNMAEGELTSTNAATVLDAVRDLINDTASGSKWVVDTVLEPTSQLSADSPVGSKISEASASALVGSGYETTENIRIQIVVVGEENNAESIYVSIDNGNTWYPANDAAWNRAVDSMDIGEDGLITYDELVNEVPGTVKEITYTYLHTLVSAVANNAPVTVTPVDPPDPEVPPEDPDPEIPPEEPDPEVPPEEPDPDVLPPEDELVDVPEDDVPLSDIPEDDVPLADLPEGDVPLTDLPDDGVPLVDVPQTGDSVELWIVLTACAALGLAVVALAGRKRFLR